MSWDQLVVEAKQEKELTFFVWWGEEYWKTAAAQFKETYGIDAKVIIGDNNVDKLDAKLGSYQEGVETKGYLVPIYRNQVGLLYDPERVQTPPQTWDKLVAFIDANPKQFAYCDPNKGGTGQAMVQTVIANPAGGLDKYKGDTELVASKVADWTKAWDWFRDTNSKVTLTASNNESIDQLNQGAVSLIVARDDDTQIAF